MKSQLSQLSLLIVCITLLSFGTHKFYVSVTDIEYNQEEKSLQIVSRIFADDLEEVLSIRYDEEVRLLPKDETENADELIEKYIEKKFEIQLKNKSLAIEYLGKKYKRDQVVLFLEAKNVNNFDEIVVENLILTDLFEGQKNLVHLKHLGTTKSAVLMKNSPNSMLKFKN